MTLGRTSSSGFTLIEVLVATLLSVVLAAALANAFLSTNLVVKSNQNVTNLLAQAELESLYKEVTYDQWNNPAAPIPLSVPPPAGTPRTHSSNAFSTSPVMDGKTYTVDYTVTGLDVNGDSVVDYRKVEARATWSQ